MLFEQSTFGETACMTNVAAADVDALKSFTDDNEDLERLETLLDRFNMFEALGIVRRENRHSDFIRWLLAPSETHGLGDYGLRQFIRQVVKAGEGISGELPSLFELDNWSLGRAEVSREWRNIDILILDEANHFVCIIENKVDSGTGPDQLQKYRHIVEREFGSYKKAFVFLTISGDPPDDEAYIPVSYRDLMEIIELVLRRRESQLNDEVKLFVQQYLDMVRRHIVEDSDIQKLCRNLYQNHRRALDLIFEHRPDRADEVSQAIQNYIGSSTNLIPSNFGKTYLKFLPCGLDVLPRKGTVNENNLILACLLENRAERVRFRLELGPGPQEIRESVYDKAKSLPKTFDSQKTKLSPSWHALTRSETWINQNEYNDLNDEDIGQRIGERIQSFFERKGNAVADALKELKFAEMSEES